LISDEGWRLQLRALHLRAVADDLRERRGVFNVSWLYGRYDEIAQAYEEEADVLDCEASREGTE
jgi:hypothetical protein